MRKVALFLILVALSLPMYARNVSRLARMTASNPAAMTVTPVDGDLPARLLAQLKTLPRRATTRTGVHASAILDSVSARYVIIPAAGSVAGGGGSLFFRSD